MYSVALLFFIVLAAVITYYIIPLLRSKVSAEEQAEMMKWVQIAVAAAEQLFKGKGRGKEKKAQVLEWLESRDNYLSDSVIDVMIESAVFELNGGKKKTDTDPADDTPAEDTSTAEQQ